MGDGFKAGRAYADLQGHGQFHRPLFDKALHGPLGRHADEGVTQGIAQARLFALCQWVPVRHQHHQPLAAKRQRQHPIADNAAVIHADFAITCEHGTHDVGAAVLGQLQIDFRVVGQKRAKHGGQQAAGGHGGGGQAQGDAALAGELL
ncbi:hypothetical protein D3C77_426100 [compost metagenome]